LSRFGALVLRVDSVMGESIVCFYDPANPEYDPYWTVTLLKEFVNSNFTQAYSLRIDFDVKQKITAGKYTNSILLLTSDGKVVR